MPFLRRYEDVEPVNVASLIGSLSGAWPVFVLLFAMLFPFAESGRGRLIKIFRACMPWLCLPRPVKLDLEEYQRNLSAIQKERAALLG